MYWQENEDLERRSGRKGWHSEVTSWEGEEVLYWLEGKTSVGKRGLGETFNFGRENCREGKYMEMTSWKEVLYLREGETSPGKERWEN